MKAVSCGCFEWLAMEMKHPIGTSTKPHAEDAIGVQQWVRAAMSPCSFAINSNSNAVSTKMYWIIWTVTSFILTKNLTYVGTLSHSSLGCAGVSNQQSLRYLQASYQRFTLYAPVTFAQGIWKVLCNILEYFGIGARLWLDYFVVEHIL